MVPEAVRGLLNPRRADTHKRNYGHVLVLAGSPGFTGAAALCALGALRAGSGLVTAGVPAGLQDVLAVKLTEAMTWALPQTAERTLAANAADDVLQRGDRYDAVALGPGLSLEAGIKTLVKRLAMLHPRPMVVDADALTVLVREEGVLRRAAAPRVITPHTGELARLLQTSVEEIQRDREGVARRVAQEWRVTVVLKGHHTVVAHLDGACYVNETGHPGMASGGSGDVLTGLIAGLLGQRLSAFAAAKLGVYLHGLAGDLARERIGEAGLLASDVAHTIPQAIRQYLQGTPT